MDENIQSSEKVVLSFGALVDPIKFTLALLTYIPIYGNLDFLDIAKYVDVVFYDKEDNPFATEGFDIFGQEQRSRTVINILTGRLGYEGQEDRIIPNNLAASVRMLDIAIDKGYVNIVTNIQNVNENFIGNPNKEMERLKQLTYEEYYIKINDQHGSFEISPDASPWVFDSYMHLLLSGKYNAITSSLSDFKKTRDNLIKKNLTPLENRTGILKRFLSHKLELNTLNVNYVFELLEKGISINDSIIMTESEINRSIYENEMAELKKDIFLFWPKYLIDQFSFGILGVIEWGYQVFKFAKVKGTKPDNPDENNNT